MASWAATSIRNRFPTARLVWAVESRCSPVIDDERLVTRLHEFPRDRWKSNRWSPDAWREQLLRHVELRRERFDFGLDLQGHSKTAMCLRIASPGRRLAARGTDPLARRLNPTLVEPPEVHTVDWNHRALTHFDDFLLPDRPAMPQVPRPVEAELVTLSVAAGNDAKRYPNERWCKVASVVRSEGFRVHVVGGPADPPLGDESVDLVGRLSLRGSMAEIASSRLHIAADTGTGHIAAAYGVPSVSVFGPMHPDKYRPYGPLATVLHVSRDPKDVPVEEVISAVMCQLARLRCAS
jgi:ADP-heptose:LPS heptosyltransferase